MEEERGASGYRRKSAQAIDGVLARVAASDAELPRLMSRALGESVGPSDVIGWRTGSLPVPMEAFSAACEIAGLSLEEGYELTERSRVRRHRPAVTLAVVTGSLALVLVLGGVCGPTAAPVVVHVVRSIIGPSQPTPLPSLPPTPPAITTAPAAAVHQAPAVAPPADPTAPPDPAPPAASVPATPEPTTTPEGHGHGHGHGPVGQVKAVLPTTPIPTCLPSVQGTVSVDVSL